MRRFLLYSGALAGARAEAFSRLVRLAEEFSKMACSPASDPPVEATTWFDEHVLVIGFRWISQSLEPGPLPSLDDDDADEVVMTYGIMLALMNRQTDRLAGRRLPDGQHELVCCVDQ
jgi:hypothetical protein